MQTPIERLLAKLPDAKQVAKGWAARCPAHEDRRASLSIAEGDDGRALVKCHAGCTADSICAKVGLKLAELMPYKPNGNGKPNPAAASRIVASYDYRDETGNLLFQVVRFDPKDFRQRKPKPGDGWEWSVKGVRVVPYRLPELLADPSRPVAVAEGEKDVDNLAGIGIVATCNAGGAGKWTAEHAAFLRNRRVVIFADNDDPGSKHAQQVAQSLQGVAESVKVVELDGLPPKGDVSDWIDRQRQEGIPDDLIRRELERMAAAVPEWTPTADEEQQPADGATEPREPCRPIPASNLLAQHPAMREAVIDGLARRGETVNIISASKIGKSWLAYSLLLSIAIGRDWLGTFPCLRGRCLLIDNELHPETLARRLAATAAAMGFDPGDWQSDLDIIPIRGKSIDLNGLGSTIEAIEQGEYACILADAFYRFLPRGIDENSNADITALYNRIDGYADRIGSVWINIHHSSKGDQSGKAVTDVGSGAGAQSRAADCHLVLRHHDEPDTIVLEAAVRSFSPVKPLAIRWQYPLWHRADNVDCTKLRGRLTAGEVRQQTKDKDGQEAIVAAIIKNGSMSQRELRATGLSRGRLDRLLAMLEHDGRIVRSETEIRGNTTSVYELAPAPEREMAMADKGLFE